MSGFWDKMTQEKPLIKVKDKREENFYNKVDKENQQLKAEIKRLKEMCEILQIENSKFREMYPNYPADLSGLDILMQQVCEYTGIHIGAIKSQLRYKRLIRARCLFYMKSTANGYSCRSIAKYIDKNRHSVSSSIKRAHKILSNQDFEFLKL